MTLRERLMAKVVTEPGGCWAWTGCLVRGGYGQIRVDGSGKCAHRVSYVNLYREW